MPLCFYDADTNNTLTLKEDNSDTGNVINTYSAATAATPNKVNVNYTFPQTFNTEQRKDFFILDNNSGQAGSSFCLTLLPATIGMTVSTSTAGTSYSSGGTNISSSYSSSYYQLKYNQQLNFSCDKTTKMAVYSSARNNTSPFFKDLSSSNNYSSNKILKNRCLYVLLYLLLGKNT